MLTLTGKSNDLFTCLASFACLASVGLAPRLVVDWLMIGIGGVRGGGSMPPRSLVPSDRDRAIVGDRRPDTLGAPPSPRAHGPASSRGATVGLAGGVSLK